MPYLRSQPLRALALLLLTAAGLLLFQRLGSGYVQRVVLTMGIDIMLVVALNISNGFTGVFSLGHVGFMALGAYTAAILTVPLPAKALNLPDLPPWLAAVELPFLPALLLGGTLATVVALLVGIPILRLSGHYVAVATLGFYVIVEQVLVNADTFTRGARTFIGAPRYTTVWWVYAGAALTVYCAWRLRRSPYGRSMLAQRDDPIAARGSGVNILRARLLAFAISAFFTGVAGGLFAHFIVFSPATFDFALIFSLITMLVIGGIGSVAGSVVGVVVVTLLSEVLRNLERGFSIGPLVLPQLAGLSQVVLAVIFVVTIIMRPNGLLGTAGRPAGRRATNAKGGGDDSATTARAEPDPTQPLATED